ncbi:MAG: hypothetical protein DWB42_06020 [Chloroflexi bacterium]|nr:hypothetical protein [Chloroflexota bacterium]MDL1883127.1 hypothetical protein [Anaerolineae bacterium CFX8]
MLKRLFVLLAICALAFTAAAQEDAPHEIYTVLDYGSEAFEPELWRMAAAEESTTYTSALWRYKLDEEFLFFFLYLHFDGGATEEAVSSYFSGDNLSALLANYEPWRQTGTCTIGDVTIYEFASKVGEQRRILRYWVQVITPTRVLGVNAAAPEDLAEAFDEYAARLFPEAVSCEMAG